MARPTQTEESNLFILDESFSTYSIGNVDAAKEFYSRILGIEVTDEKEGGIGLKLGSQNVYLYPKDDHKPAEFTVLNIAVTDIEAAVDELTSRGVKFESYGGDIRTDDKGIFWGDGKGMGPNIAWLKDPSGNILALIEKR